MSGYYAKRFFGKAKTPIVGYNFNGQTLDQYGALNQTLVGGATITGDKLNVTAAGQYSQSLDPTGIASFGSGAFSIACKVRLNSVVSQQIMAAKRDDSNTVNGGKAEWQFRFLNGNLNFIVYDSSKSIASNVSIISNQTLLINSDYKVAVTFSGGSLNTGFKMYVNGVQVAATLGGGGTYEQMRNNGSSLRLGNYLDFTFPILGSLDDFKLFNVELTSYEVANL